MKKLLKRKVMTGEGLTTIEKAFIETIIKKALRGDTKMIRIIWESIDGKPRRQKSRPDQDY
jgi:hypothetical protein